MLVHGADGQLLDDALAAAARGLVPDPAHRLLGREAMDGREVTVETILRSAMTLPFMMPARLVAVRHCQALSAKGEALLAEYVARPNPTTALLLLADESLRATRERRADHWLLRVVPAAATVELPVRRGRALEEWLRQRTAAEGLGLSEEAARLLVQWVGDDSGALLAEARKAALAAGPEHRSVGVGEVTAVVGEHRLSGVFDLTRAVERREVGQALKALDRLLATEEPTFLLAMLVRDVRSAWMIREWRRRGQSVDQIARALRRPPGAVEALVAYATGPGGESLPGKLRRCWDVERRLKSGGQARAEMARLVAELCDTR
ncbi:MAG: DNA polymerase III subunit delta [Candidatus Rokubacteria bacterium]|nr:DNA polymerase III subunit delta [Candidatus Rokubacteria bacterium]